MQTVFKQSPVVL